MSEEDKDYHEYLEKSRKRNFNAKVISAILSIFTVIIVILILIIIFG